MALVALAYVLYLDHIIRSQFEAKRWSLPARVYARPLDLYPEMALSARQFAFDPRLRAREPLLLPPAAVAARCAAACAVDRLGEGTFLI